MTPRPDDAELLPCPFCGRDPIYHHSIPHVRCSWPLCGCVTSGCSDKEEAYSVWNRRTPSPLLAPIKVFLASIEHAYVNIDGVSKEKWDELQRVLKEVER